MVNHLNEGQCQLYLCDLSELVNLAGARQTERGTAMRRKEHFLQILKNPTGCSELKWCIADLLHSTCWSDFIFQVTQTSDMEFRGFIIVHFFFFLTTHQLLPCCMSSTQFNLINLYQR